MGKPPQVIARFKPSGHIYLVAFERGFQKISATLTNPSIRPLIAPFRRLSRVWAE